MSLHKLTRSLLILCILAISLSVTVVAQSEPTPDGSVLVPVGELVLQPVDTDLDGIPDQDDQCPTVVGTVENNGCPGDSGADTDQDGTLDVDDACPLQPGPIDNDGCPENVDSDGDGLPDGVDGCPFEAGPRDNEGCPPDTGGDRDTDGDGTPDDGDECPEVAGPRENRGCPVDRDGDGVLDVDDACPDQHHNGAIFNGCPDTDGDGLVDNIDLCPNEAGPVDNQGCPETGVAPTDQPPVAQPPTSVPPTLPPPPSPTPEGVNPLGPDDVGINPEDVFEDCPELIGQADVFPVYIMSYLESSPDPCEDGNEIIDVVFLPPPTGQDALGPDAIADMMADCPEVLAGNLQQLAFFDHAEVQAELAAQQVDQGCQTVMMMQDGIHSADRVCYAFVGQEENGFPIAAPVGGVIVLASDGSIVGALNPQLIAPTGGASVPTNFFSWGPTLSPGEALLAFGFLDFGGPPNASIMGISVGLAGDDKCDPPADDPTDMFYCYVFDIEVTNPDATDYLVSFPVMHAPMFLVGSTYADVFVPGDQTKTVYALGIGPQNPPGVDPNNIIFVTIAAPVIVTNVSAPTIAEPSFCNDNIPEMPTPTPTPTDAPTATPTATATPGDPPTATPTPGDGGGDPGDGGGDPGDGGGDPGDGGDVPQFPEVPPGYTPPQDSGVPPVIGGTIAVFEGKVPNTAPNSDLYLLQNSQIIPLIVNTAEMETNPRLDENGAWAAFVQTDLDGSTRLRMIHTESRQVVDLFASTPDMMVMTVDPSWDVNGFAIYFSVMTPVGIPNIYRLEIINLLPSAPQMVIADGYNPSVSSTGRYIAFVRDVNGFGSIYSYTPSNGKIVPINSQPGNTECNQPAFGPDPVLLTFVCNNNGVLELNIYLYNLGGLQQLQPQDNNFANPQPGPSEGFLAHDDSQVIWFTDEQGVNRNILVQFDDGKTATNLSWVTPS